MGGGQVSLRWWRSGGFLRCAEVVDCGVYTPTKTSVRPGGQERILSYMYVFMSKPSCNLFMTLSTFFSRYDHLQYCQPAALHRSHCYSRRLQIVSRSLHRRVGIARSCCGSHGGGGWKDKWDDRWGVRRVSKMEWIEGEIIKHSKDDSQRCE